MNSHSNYESDSSSNNDDNNHDANLHARTSASQTSEELIISPPSSPSATTTAAAEHERQTLLLMLLAQVCSLHDATPRTFVVHVLALFERGILDSNSIRFLFDLGLVPRGYSEQFSGCFEEASSVTNNDTTGEKEQAANNAAASASAIVPYAANNTHQQQQQHAWMRQFPSPPLLHNNTNQNTTNKQQQQPSNNTMATRQSQASAIRRQLAHQESIDTSSAHSTVFGSANAGFIPGITSAATTTSTVDESFHTPFYENNNSDEERRLSQDQFQNNSATHTQQQLSTNNNNNNNIPTTSWSVEHHPLSLSRYQREFHQLSLLATGSFGSVYHAIHKLEHKPYAVKRVTFSTTGYYANTLALVIREVRCLAQLDHKNCVRYYTSWLEPSWMTGDQQYDNKMMGEEGEEEDEEQSMDDDIIADGPKLLPHIERVVNEINSTGEVPHSVQRLEAILYGNNKDGTPNTTDDGFEWDDPVSSTHLHQRNNGLPSHKTTTTNQASVYSYGSDVDDDDSDVSDWTNDMNGTTANSSSFEFHRQSSLELVPADQHKASAAAAAAAPYKYQICLFIQMQLCHPTTLADWIKQRNHNCTQFGAEERQARARPAFEAFRQIVNGLAHVHSKGIIHRDLKPANIFASDDGTWMIGDFGLSKMMRDAQGGVDIDPHNNGIILPNNGYSNVGAHHTAGVGTASYAAPEQITRKNYGPAVDIFSLGLILLELFSNFTSEHERAVAFHDCRYHGELAPWMTRIYPDVASLVLACTQKDWTQRPTASEILSASAFQEGLSGVEIYRAELTALNQELIRKDDLIQSQNDVIQSQNFELAEKDELIQQLKLRLENAGISIENGFDEESDTESSKNDY
ncbi:hypothetical protein ACHAXM_008721 [Skeletonema potamos]